jgi:hypothetical protein
MMETTEKIVETYVRYVLTWATIPNIRCKGQLEIDLLAIDPVKLDRYHIETSVSSSNAFSRLTAGVFDPQRLKERTQKPKMRRTLEAISSKTNSAQTPSSSARAISAFPRKIT